VTDSRITITNKSNFPMPLDVLVEYADGSKELFYIPLREMRGEKPAENYAPYANVKRATLEDWFWTKPTYTFEVRKKVRQVQIDPTQRLADVESGDNGHKR